MGAVRLSLDEIGNKVALMGGWSEGCGKIWKKFQMGGNGEQGNVDGCLWMVGWKWIFFLMVGWVGCWRRRR